MSEAVSTSVEGISSNMNQIMDKITATMNQLVMLFERSIDAISTYGVGVAQRVKDFGIKFLKTMGFVDKELFQLWYIKHHLRDIHRAVESNDPTVIQHAETLFGSLQEMWDLLVHRMNMDHAYFKNFGYAVLEVKKMKDDILSKVYLYQK